MSQNISNSATSNVSPTQNQMSMQNRMPQSQLGPIPQQPTWSSGYYGQPNQSPYMNPYMPHGAAGAMPNHASQISQPPLSSIGQKPPSNPSDRTRAAYPPHSNLYTQPLSSGGPPGGYYGYDSYYNQDPYLTHSSSTGAPHWSSSTPNNSMMTSNPPGSLPPPPLRPPTGSSGMLPQAQNASTGLPPLSTRPPPPPQSSQTPERNQAPEHMMSSYDRQRGANLAQQSQHPSAILSQNVPSSVASTLSPTQHQMGMQGRMQPQSQMASMNQPASWSSSYYSQSTQSPYMSPYMPHGGAGSIPGHGSSMTQPPSVQMGSKPPTNGSDRPSTYPPHSSIYGQPPPPPGASSSYYSYDQSYGQMPTDLYPQSSQAPSHWPTPPTSGMLNTGPGPGSAGPIQTQLRPQSSSGQNLQSQGNSVALTPLGSRSTVPSLTPERSTSISTSYPSPNQQGSAPKSGSNSLAQLEQMVMPGSSQPPGSTKSPTQRSTTSSPSTSAAQPPPMQYSYNSGGQSNYFGPGPTQPQSSYYPSYEPSDNADPGKTTWSDGTSNPLMSAPPPGSGMDPNTSYGQSYEGSAGYADYTQLSTPSQSRFPVGSDIPIDQGQIDKTDPYAIDSQTFEDNDDQSVSTKAKKPRAKKGDDSSKKERRQRAPKASKVSTPAVLVPKSHQSPTTNSMPQSVTATRSVPNTPEVPQTACDVTEPSIPLDEQQQISLKSSDETTDQGSLSGIAAEHEPSAKNDNSSPATSLMKSFVSVNKSPQHQSEANSSSICEQSRVPYQYNAPPPPTYPYSSGPAINHNTFYPPYGPSSTLESQKPAWVDQSPTIAMDANATSSMAYSNGAPNMAPISSDQGSNSYSQYTQLSAPSHSEEVVPEVAETSVSVTDSKFDAENNDLTPIQKTKKSRSKKSDDSSKRERKPRPSRAQKSSATVQQQLVGATTTDSQPQLCDEGTQPLQNSEHAEEPSDLVGEAGLNEEKPDPEVTAKPKRSRPKKSGDKPKRPSRAVQKQEVSDARLDETNHVLPATETDQSSMAANESVEDEQDATATDTTPSKPKRIRIRDSSSKSKKKLPKFALKFAKTKKRKRLGSSDNEQSDLEKTPPPSPDEDESGVQKRRSARNTKKLKYNDDIGLGFSDSDDDSQTQSRKKSTPTTAEGDLLDESAVAEEPTVFAAPVEDTMVVEKIMASRTGRRELEPEPGEVLPPDGTFIDIEEFYVKYKNMSYLHCDWRTLEELERGDRRVAQKIKRFKQKKDNSNLFSFMDEEIFDPQYCEVDRILAVNEVEEMVPASDDEEETVKISNPTEGHVTEKPSEAESSDAPAPMQIDSTHIKSSDSDKNDLKDPTEVNIDNGMEVVETKSEADELDREATKPEITPPTQLIDSDKTEVHENKNSETDASYLREGDIQDQSSKERHRKMKKKVSRHYLVKWRSLTYEDSTWELEEHLDPEKIKHFERFKDPPPKSKWKAVKRPKPEEWVRKEVSPVYKNNNTLREYQLEGINWLSFCWHQGRNCILADEMGLGKTIQSIAFINEIHEKGIYGPFLIIVPLSTVGNWAREFETWTDLNVITYHGGSTSREMLKEYEMFYRNEQGNRITQVYKFQVMITTFEIILSDCLDLMKIPWRCCIIDEAHRLKNRNCKLLEGLRLLNMEHRVLLTGTPLQNNVEELFSLLNFLEPTQFASTEQFLLEFGDLKTEAQVDKLKLILKPMMLRRLKEDVEKTLAPKEETIVEVELTNIQKKYYRAILERNFSFLQKGSTNNNMPNLMNTMMELRKCCIHPYLINGAEEQILYEARENKLADGTSMSSHQAMINASGKLVLLDKLLPRLKADGHRVLIFSQMVRCLDILEDYVTHKQYPYERIDGRVRGGDRQQAIDRYSKPGSDRFIFLLCTRAGGLGINLTAADTVIIFDSDWNPQNDLQAQARCHRIGQSKAVKIYRLICRNTYEREMFDKASLKLGLDKAVLQSMNTQKASGLDGQLTKKEIEELLRKGAYGALMDDDNAGDKFCEEDIDQILQRRTQVITIESTEAKGSTFSKATFSSSNNREDIELDDPDFWEKWAKKANIDPEDLLSKEELVQLAPRRRTQTKRYGADGNLIEMSDLESSEEDEETISMRTRGSRRGTSKSTPTSVSKRSKRHKFLDDEEDELMANIDGGYWSKSDCLKIESGMLTYGWGRWEEIIANNRFKKEITVEDCENICRVILLYCLNSYKGDEKIKSFIWELILPSGEITSADSETNSNVSSRGRKPKSAPVIVKKTIAEEISDAQWPKEAQNDPLIALPDDQYRRHLQRNCNRLLIRVRFLHYLKHDILRGYDDRILADCNVSEVEIPPIPHDGEIPVYWWDDEADKSLLVGIFKHGHDNFNLIRQDSNLCFLKRCGPPTKLDLSEELNNKNADCEEQVDTRLHINLKKTAAGACLHELLNNVVRELREESSQADKSDEIIDENKNSILKCNETCDSIDNLGENGINESSQTKLDITDDDSLLNDSSTDNNVGEQPMSKGCVPPAVETDSSGFLTFPSANELNQRFRRLVTTYQKISKKLEIQLAQRVRDELKKERTSKFEAAKNEREERKRFQAQKWSRREESDFVKAISFFGVEYDPKLKKHDWNKFRLIGKLEKKMDETLEDYYKAFTIMCKKATSQPLTQDEENYPLNIEAIAQDRASRCLSKIDFFNKVRINIIKHPQLDKRLKKCQTQSDLPDWWKDGLHDKDLLIAVAKHGLYRLDYNLAHDPDLIFESVIREKVEDLFANPPSSILIPLDQLQELLDRNGVEYLKDVELDDDSEIIKVMINSLIDKIEQEENGEFSQGVRGKTRSGLSRPSTRKSANTVIKSAESKTSSNCIRLTSFGDSRNFDHRVAEVTPVMSDKIPRDLKRTHEAGEVSVTIQSESALLKLDDKPPIVLLGASNPIVVKIRWPKDKAIQTRLENLIHLIENNEWPNSSKSSVPTITLPGHLAAGNTSTTATTPQRPSDDASEGLPPIDSPSLDLGTTSSRSSRNDSKEVPIVDAPVTRGRRGKGRRPKQPEADFYNQEFESPPKEDRQAPAKLRNLLSQGTSSSRASTSEKSSKFLNNEKQSPNLSSLLASFRNKKGESSVSSRTRDEKRTEPVEPTLPNSANLLPQILANMKPEYRELLNNPEAASLLMNTLSNFPGLGNLSANLRQPISTPSTHIHNDTSASTSRTSSKSYRGDRSSTRSSNDKQPTGGLSSLLATFKQQKTSSAPSPRDDRNLLEQTLPGASNLLPQIMANMGPQFRDLLNNPDAASLLMNSLGGLTNFANLRQTTPETNKSTLDNLLQSTRQSSKGPPPAHQRSDNVPSAHDSSTRELRRSSQSTRDSSSTVKSTRSRVSVPDIDIQPIAQLKTDDSSNRSSFSKRRGRPSSISNENPPPPAVDILDLSSLQQSRKGSSLLRSETRTRRIRDLTEEISSVSTRSSGASSRSTSKVSSRHQEQERSEDAEQSTSMVETKQDQAEKSGRSTRASKRIGSRIDALALNLQAKRLNVSDSPESSPTPSREPSHDNQMLAHGSKSSTSETKIQSPKAPPAAHSGTHKTSTSSEHHRSRDKGKHNSSSSSVASLGLPTSSSMSSSTANRPQDSLAQLMAQVAPQTSSIAASLSGQSNVTNQARQDPLAQLMSNPILASLNPNTLGGGTGDLMNQLLRKAGSNDFVKNLINEFVKNPNLASMDPNILASLAASMPMSSQSLPNFTLPTTATTSMPFGNFTNPMANPFLPFNMANLGMSNPLTNPLSMFPNLYMPTGFPQQPQQQLQQPQSRQQPNQSSGSSDGGPKDKKMRYSRK